MTTTITLEQAQNSLEELLTQFGPDDEIVILKDEQPIARLVAVDSSPKRQSGTLQGTVTYLAPDFDAPLDDFQDDWS